MQPTCRHLATRRRRRGTAVDPRNLEAQLQSGVIFGLGAAPHGEITCAKGAAKQTHFHNDTALPMQHAPRIVVEVLESGGSIRGVGEPQPPGL